MPDAKTLLGRRIRDLRVQRRLSQEKLGEMSQVSGKYLGEIERGQANLTIDIAERLSIALEVEMVDLFDYGHEMGNERLKEEINSLIHESSAEDLKRIFRMLKSLTTEVSQKLYSPDQPTIRSSASTKDFRGSLWLLLQTASKSSLNAVLAMMCLKSEKAKLLRPLTLCRRSGVFSSLAP